MTRPFMKHTLKTLMSGVLAATLLAMPAQASDSQNDQDVAAIIATLFGLVAIGSIIANSNDDDGKTRAVTHTHRTPHRYTHSHTYRGDHSHPPKTVSKRRVPRHLRLPGQCHKKFRTQSGKRKYFGMRCLKQNFSYVHDLPRACRDTVVVRNKQGVYVARKVYQPSCLYNKGYRMKDHY